MDRLQGRAGRGHSGSNEVAPPGRGNPRLRGYDAKEAPPARARECAIAYLAGRRQRRHSPWKTWLVQAEIFVQYSPLLQSKGRQRGCRKSWNCFPAKKTAIPGCKDFSKPRAEYEAVGNREPAAEAYPVRKDLPYKNR